MDEGTAALVPSYRPPGLQQIVVGAIAATTFQPTARFRHLNDGELID